VACVADMYHRFTGDRGPIEAQETHIDYSDTEYVVDLNEAFEYLGALSCVDGGKIGVADFCVSGRIALSYVAERGSSQPMPGRTPTRALGPRHTRRRRFRPRRFSTAAET
jgi:dienelactone hydrolase